MTVSKQNCIHDEIKKSLNMGNVCYCSVCPIWKHKDKMYKIMILFACETVSQRGKDIDWRCLRRWCWSEYMNLTVNNRTAKITWWASKFIFSPIIIIIKSRMSGTCSMYEAG